MGIVIAIGVCIAVYFIQYRLYRSGWRKELSVAIGFDEDYVRCGGTAHITETVTNEKGLPLTALHLKFNASRTFEFADNKNANVTDYYHRNDGFIVMGHQRITRRLEFTASARGYYCISRVKLMAMDFFMTRSYAETLPDESWIYVLPERETSYGLDVVFCRMLGEMNARFGLMSDPYSVRCIREYAGGDPVSAINWKATARRSEPMVNVYEHVAGQRVKLLLNLDTHSMIKQTYIQELSIRIAGSLAEFFISHGIPAAMETNGRDVVTGECAAIDFGASALHILSIDKCLARIECRETNGDFLSVVDRAVREMDTRTTYIVVSSYCKQDLLIKLDYLCGNGASVYMIAPNFDVSMPGEHRDYIHGVEVVLDET